MSRKRESDSNESRPEDQSDWIDELYAEGQDELPPPALDARIQAAARTEVRRPWYFSPPRLTTLATAASLVLAAMVIYYLPEDAPAPASEADQASSTGAMMPSRDLPESTAARQTNTGALKTLSTESPLLQEQEQPWKTAPQADITGNRAMARSPEPPAAPMESKKAERYRTATDELAAIRAEAMRENLPVESATMGRASSDYDAQARLAELCGPLPGTEETRSLHSDAVDWYLTVTDVQSSSGAAADQRYWRCQDGAWIELAEPVFETPSVEQ